MYPVSSSPAAEEVFVGWAVPTATGLSSYGELGVDFAPLTLGSARYKVEQELKRRREEGRKTQ